jgi:hypothetical protein
MAAVTQFIPTFLGGVSRQTDTKKQPGQVNEILNGYPDPTYGLLKRNGSQFLGLLSSYVNDNSDTLKNGHWFTVSRDNDERYIGVITTTGNIRIWNTVPQNAGGILTFTEATITNKTAADVVSYLTPPNTTTGLDDFYTFSYLDQTYIVNKNKTVLMNAKTNYYLYVRATVVLASVEHEREYAVWVNGTKYTYNSPNNTNTLTGDMILTGLKTALDAGLSANYTVTKYSNSLEIERNDGQTPFTIEVRGGTDGIGLTVYQDEVSSPARLAASTKPGRRVKVLNSVDERASYFVKFVSTGNSPGANNAVTAGSGYWEESVGWDIDTDQNGVPIATAGKYVAQLASNGLNAETMPYKLVNTGTNQFSISKETWSPRLTGNDYGNPLPSFVGSTIKFGLIYSNRLIFLTADTIVMSVAKDFENFFFTSAQTVLASDPVDVETSSTRVSNLYCAVPQAQGLILFSEYEQYLLYSESGIISPSDNIVRTISQYESDRSVLAQDTGEFIGFVARGSGYSRLLGMQPRGNLESAEVADISKIVAGYLPPDAQRLTVNAQDSLLALYSKQANSIYLYKYYTNGKEQLMQAWFRWKMPDEVQIMVTIDNYLVVLTRGNGEYKVSYIDLVQGAFTTTEVDKVSLPEVRLDYSYIAGSAGAITYNSNTNKSTLPRTYKHITGLKPVAMTVPTVAPGPSTSYSNLFIPTTQSNTTVNYVMDVEVDNNGNWLIEGNWVGKQFDLVVGYEYDFDIELPRYFYKSDRTVDWTSSLTIARIKFDVGLSGSVNFYIKRFGSPEWKNTVGVQYAGYYLANSSPIVDRTTLTVPIHQKNTNYDLRINSNSPFPVAFNSMTWEGNYAPRYYRRA